MNDSQSPDAPRLSAEQAFVVHLLEAGAVVGRVEHVASGRCARFASAAELVDFMRRVLDRTAEVA